MTSDMTPGQLMLLLQIHCFPYQDQITIDNGSNASRIWYVSLLEDALIECVDHGSGQQTRPRCPYRTTSRGEAFIEKLRVTPLPVLVEKWV